LGKLIFFGVKDSQRSHDKQNKKNEYIIGGKMESLLLIKPNATKSSKIGSILKMLESEGFFIKKIKSFHFDRSLIEEFYAIHKDKDFFEDLSKFMSSGTTIAVLLEKENAIDSLRQLIGNTDPQKAKDRTIRKLFGKNITQNAVHASDNSKNAKKEIKIIFNKM